MLHRDDLAIHVQNEHRAQVIVEVDAGRYHLPVESAVFIEDGVQATQCRIVERVSVLGPLAFVFWSGLDPKVVAVVQATANPWQAESEGEDGRPLDGWGAVSVRHCDDLIDSSVVARIFVRVKASAVAETVDLDSGDGLVGTPRDVDHARVLVEAVHQGVKYVRDISHLDVFDEAKVTPGVGALGQAWDFEGED